MIEATTQHPQMRQKKVPTTSLLNIELIVLGVLVLVGCASTPRQNSTTASEESFPTSESSLHILTLADPYPTYTTNPPTSGYHLAQTANGGIYDQPIPDEVVVHNLEHGAVVIHYRQGLDQETVDKLKLLARDLQQQNDCMILMPRPADKIDTPITLTSWGWMLKLQEYNEVLIRNFFKKHINNGPEKLCGSL